MKRSWIPAALMGALGLGYLAGSRDEGSPRGYEAPPASSIVSPPAPPVNPPMSEDSPSPIPIPVLDDRLSEYPAWNGVDLDCNDIGHPVRVTGPDPHRLDNDGNGIGCESY
jgi:micrococcal nuclease